MTTSAHRVVGLLAASVLGTGLLATLPSSPAYAADPVAGAQTSGDSLFPNQGNGGYDVSHYDLAMAVNVAVSSTSGAVSSSTVPAATASITAATTGAPLSSYSFDFQGSTGNLAASTFNIDSVTVDGSPASFSRIENTTTSNAVTDIHKLIVTPSTPVSGQFTTVVKYSGKPVAHTDTDGSSEGWNNTTDGATFVNQPVGAMTLFPNNNTPHDKATYTISVDAPTTLTTSNYANAGGKPYPAGVASNGELVSRTPSSDGSRTTWVWDETKPMASELSLVSVGRYDIYQSNISLASGRTIPEWTFIDPAISVANQTTTLGTRAQLKPLLDFYETKYGPYPGKSTGIVTDVVPSAINYALETQDRPFFPNSASRGTTYHEIMHQWWGDNVSPTDWNDIVLNEGPATYAETQFPYEGAGSSTTPTETSIYNAFASSSPTSSVWAVPSAAMTQASQLFGSHVYTRGNYSLEALRTSIGAGNFETLMRQYQLIYGGGQIAGRRTAAYQALAESISGRDLTAFFNTWWYTTGKPAWPAKYNLNLVGPTTQVNPGDAASYTLAVRNTGKVAMANGAAIITVDANDVLDDATIGTLPANVSQNGTTLTWTVPATALGATSTVTIPVTVNPGTAGNPLAATARATTLGSTCVDCASSIVIGNTPISPAPAPTITGGTPTVGQTLTADTSGWDPATTFTYQWLIDGTPVPGATAATYTPTVDVVGFPVTVRVTGTQSGFNPTSQTSAPTPAGVRAALTSAVPTISGTPKIGVPLTVDPGTWQSDTVFTYQWAANGTSISGATGPVYTPAVSTQVGQTVTVTVTGTKSGYVTTSRTSAPTSAVAAGDPLSSTPTPVLPAAAPKVGVVYAPNYGSWDDGVTLTFQWQANGTNISGATAGSYTPTASQVGQTLNVVVTGTKPGIPPVTKTSAVSAAVESGTQTLQPTPTITGTPRAGTASTGVPGTWDSGTTLTYQWLADGTPIAGATALTYTPTPAQIGAALTFAVTSTKAGYATVTKTSAAKTVLAMTQTLTPTPVISGTPKVGSLLTGGPGTWDNGTTLTYQWLADGTAIPGATDLTYTPTPSELGKAMTFSVTSTRMNYETVTKTSDATDPVAAGDLANTPRPTISGTAQVGETLTAVTGAWDSGTTFAYQWTADGTPVSGATSATFTPSPAELGAAIRVMVTGSKPGYTPVTKTSDATDPVAAGDLADTPRPTISGTAQVGETLTAVTGAWDSGTTFAYQWTADATPVSGATSATFTPSPAELGAAIRVMVTGSKPGYTPVTKTSVPTDPVAAGDLANTPRPTISGTAQVGETLTAVTGAWDSGTTFAYQWTADGTPVSGATSATFTPSPAELGAAIRVMVTGSKPGYTPVTKTSDATDPVAAGDLTDTPKPTISGTAQVGETLTADAGTWDPGTSLSYQWVAGTTLVDGATGSTYVPVPDDVGARLKVRVTGTKPGYTTVTKVSDPTDPVAPGDQISTPKPTITGTPQVGQQLTAVPGTWDAATTLAYQWTADGTPVSGATSDTFTPSPDELGAAIRVAVTGTKPGYTTVTKTSDPTDAVAPGDQSSTPKPVIWGTPTVGQQLTAVPGTWDSGTTLSYQWSADGSPVSGATSQAFTPSSAELGAAIRVAVTGTEPGYTTVTKTSDPTDPVAPGTQTKTPTPTITGTVKVGETLTAHAGTWDSGTTLSYQWYVAGKAVSGATATTFVPRVADVGSTITVRVTSSKPGYVTVTESSSPTTAVPKVETTTTVTSSANPSVSGNSVTLTAHTTMAGDPATGKVSFLVTPASGAKVKCAGGASPNLDSTGRATCRLTGLKAASGPYTVTATYAASRTSAASSDTLTQEVDKSTTKTTVSTPTSPAPAGQPLLVMVTVTPVTGAVVPTGTVQVTVTTTGGAVLTCSGSRSLKKGSMSCTVPAKSVRTADGPLRVDASYPGSAESEASSATKSIPIS